MARGDRYRSINRLGRLAAVAIAISFFEYVAQTEALAVSACVQPPASLVSWWPGDGNADDVWGGNNGTPEAGVSFVTGEVGQAFHFDSASDQFVQTTNAANLGFTGSEPFSIDAWVRTSETAHNLFIASKQTNSARSTATVWASPTARPRPATQAIRRPRSRTTPGIH